MFMTVLCWRDGRRANGAMLKMLAMLGLLAVTGLTSRPATAAPIYQVSHTITFFGAFGVAPQGTPIDYVFPYQETDSNINGVGAFSSAAVEVGPGFVRLNQHTFTNQTAPAGQHVDGKFTFDVLFASPNSDPIDVVINLEVSGTMAPSGLYSHLFIHAGIPPSGAFGLYSEIDNMCCPSPLASGALSTFVDDGTVQAISTFFLNIPVNVPVTLQIQLATDAPHADFDSQTIDFTYSLATSGNVFTLLSPVADDIVVTSTDANIVDNVFQVPGAVAVPSAPPAALALALLASGLIGLAGRGRQQRRKRAAVR